MAKLMKITVTQEEIDALLDAAETQEKVFWEGREMIVSYKLASGFTVAGRSAMIDPTHFDAAIGRKYCREDASDQLWKLEGYRKQLEMTRDPAKTSSSTKPDAKFLLNTYKYFVDLPHQHKAIAYLEQQLGAEVAKEFMRLWREDPGNQKAVTPAEKPKALPVAPLQAIVKPSRLVDKIVGYMKSKGYQIYTTDGKRNIVYIEGMNPDGTLNDDSPNWFNDLRCVFEFRGDTPEILGMWGATTEPGFFYTENPLNMNGCARIQFGQYHAWQVGYHGNADPHEALVQCDNVTVCRDLNQDYSRKGDELFTGWGFGINQHWGGDSPEGDIGAWSAGCLVGRTRDGHRKFMQIVKEDIDYQKNNEYVFSTTVIPGDDLIKRFPD